MVVHSWRGVGGAMQGNYTSYEMVDTHRCRTTQCSQEIYRTLPSMFPFHAEGFAYLSMRGENILEGPLQELKDFC